MIARGATAFWRRATAISRGAIKAGPGVLSTARYAALLAIGVLSMLASAPIAAGQAGGWTVRDTQPSGSFVLGASGTQLGGYFRTGYGQPNAIMWNAVTGSLVVLHPTFPPDPCPGPAQSYATSSAVQAVDGGQQVGATGTVNIYQGQLTYCPSHAALWSGTALSWVDLGPPGFESEAYGIDGGQQVGNVWFSTTSGSHAHASLWSGTAASWVDLNPSGTLESNAFAVRDGQQVGSVKNAAGRDHASLWTGTATSWVDLNPAGSIGSVAYAVEGGRQGGYAVSAIVETHAGLWSGTAASWVDLNPSGSTESKIYDIHGDYQVGYAVIGGFPRAGIWKGTAASWVNLSDYLDPRDNYNSRAYAITSDGISLYVGGYPKLWSRPICAGDFNRSGTLDAQDLFDFLSAWFGSDPRADFNGNGLSVQDIFDFLAAWFAGC